MTDGDMRDLLATQDQGEDPADPEMEEGDEG